jgi:cysteine-rich repeat protein
MSLLTVTGTMALAGCADGGPGPWPADTFTSGGDGTWLSEGSGDGGGGETSEDGGAGEDSGASTFGLEEGGEGLCGDGVVDLGEACDDGNDVDVDACTNACELAACGDGIVSALVGEACDDGDEVDQDGCDSDCQPSAFVSVAAGREHSCALNRVGEVWCWGSNVFGQLGYGVLENLGDDEGVAAWGAVPLGGKAIDLAVGALHSCALMEDGVTIRCWGRGSDGLLGQGSSTTIGDDEPASDGVSFAFEQPVQQLALGRSHSCVRLEDATVRCWGSAEVGALGVPGMTTLGDDELGNAGEAVQLGSAALDLSVGEHACALVEGEGLAQVRCWGPSEDGELGLGTPSVVVVGDDEAPESLAPVMLGFGVTPRAVAAGVDNSCAIVDERIRCWGEGWFGTNGNSTIVDIGDDEGPLEAVSTVLLAGEYPVAVELGENNACTLLESGRVRCWGSNAHFLFGYTFVTEDLGDDEPGSAAPANRIGDPDDGGQAVALSVGDTHACVLTEAGRVRCWGANEAGQLGYADTEVRGDGPGELEQLEDLPLWRP